MVEEIFRDTFNKWGTYESLKKDCKIVRYFMDNLDKKIRQKTVIKQFGYMHPKTVRIHIYRLVKKKVIYEDENYKGTYFMPSEHSLGAHGFIDDMNKLIIAIVGQDIYDIAISNLKMEYETEIAELKKRINEYIEDLRQYR